jgi:hypothetical protein
MKGLHGWDEHLIACVLILAFVALILGFAVAYAVLFYGDWHCAFATCRRVVS